MALNAVERPDVTTLEPESNNNPETDSEESLKNVSEQRVKRKLSNCIDKNNVKKHKLCSSSSDEDAIASSEDSNNHLLKEMQINRSKNIICSSNEENGVEEPDSEIKLPEKVQSEGSSLKNDVLPLMKIRENMKNPIVLIEKLETKSAILSSSDSENDSSSKRNHHSKVQSKSPTTASSSESDESDSEVIGLRKKPMQRAKDEDSCNEGDEDASLMNERKKFGQEEENSEKMSVGSGSNDSGDESLDLKKKKIMSKAALLQSDEDESSRDKVEDSSSVKKKEKGSKKENKVLKKPEMSVGSDSNDSDDETLEFKKEKNKKSNYKAKLLQSDEDESSCDKEGYSSSAKKKRRGTNKGNKLMKNTEKISVGSDSSDSDDEPLGLKKEKSQKSNFKAKLLQSDEDESSCDMEGDISSAKKNRRGTKKENKLTKKTEKISEGSDSSDSDDEPLGLKKEKSQKSNFKAKLLQSDQDENSCDNVEKRSLLKNQKKDLKKENKLIEKKKQVSVSSENDDSESDIQEFKKKKSSNMDQRIHSDEDGNSGDAVEDNPIQNENGKINSKDTKSEEIPEKMSVGSDSNDSDDETLDLKKKKSNFKAKLQQSDEDESSCDKVEDSKSITKNRKGSKKENKPLEKTEKISVKSDSSDSDNETLDLKKEKSKRGNFKNKQLHSDEDENSCDTVEDISSKKKKKDSKKENKYTEKTEKVKKTSPASNNRIEHLKKYVRAAGIRVPCYSKLFEKCKSQKSKEEKILELLHKQGLKGKPTLEKCKKLRKRIETRKEFAELDQANIIQSEGRRKRGTTDETIDKKPVKTPPPKKIFSRLKDIFDSEESD